MKKIKASEALELAKQINGNKLNRILSSIYKNIRKKSIKGKTNIKMEFDNLSMFYIDEIIYKLKEMGYEAYIYYYDDHTICIDWGNKR